MINHARTLLLNCKPLTNSEYTPTYTPKKLPPSLQNIWNIFFGDGLTDDALNYRANQLMTIVHIPEFEEYVTELDPRITYWPFKDDLRPEPKGLLPLADVIEALNMLIQHDGPDIFGQGIRQCMEKFETYWYEHKQAIYRLGAIMMALIYRIEDLDEVEGC